jgi:hypothetical protein
VPGVCLLLARRRQGLAKNILVPGIEQLIDERQLARPDILERIDTDELGRRVEASAGAEAFLDEWIVGVYENKRLDPRDICSVAGGELTLFVNTAHEVDGHTSDYRGRLYLSKEVQFDHFAAASSFSVNV